MRRALVSSLAVAAGLLVLAAPVAARAQGDASPSHDADVTRAESLFNAAKALLEAGQNADACAKFAESKRLAVGLGVTLYLADCYERIGRTASAWTEFRSAEGLARQRGDRRAEVARGRAQAIEPKLDRLTIAVAPSVPRADLQVLRDGVAVPPEEWGVAVPVDPGDHVVVASAPGHVQRTVAAHLGPEASTATVHIDRLEDAPVAPLPAVAVLPGPSPETAPPAPGPSADGTSAPDWTRRWVGVGIGGAGVVGIGVGAAFGWIAKSKLDESNDGPCDATDHCSTAGRTLRHDAGSAATVSTIAFAAGGAALAAGLVIYLTAPRGPASSGLALAPLASPGGGGGVLEGRF